MPKGTRLRPKHLAAKLLAIRQALGFSQAELANALDLKLTSARISEYENGVRELSLIALLRYARVAQVAVEVLIDDKLKLNTVEISRRRSPQ